MKKIIIKTIQWFSDFNTELKELKGTNKSKNLKNNIRLIQDEKENLKGELEFYIEELKVKNTKQMKNVKGLTLIVNILILISATFTILGFNLHKLLFDDEISTIIVGTALIIGLLLIQYLCFYASSIETVIEERFNRHTMKLKAIKYILLPISIIGTYNFLIGYINFLDNKIVNSLMVLMICISIDFSILVFNNIKYDKKHLIFSNRNKQKLENEESIIKMILFNLLGEKLLKIKLAYKKNSVNYYKKLAQNEKIVSTNLKELAQTDKIVSTNSNNANPIVSTNLKIVSTLEGANLASELVKTPINEKIVSTENKIVSTDKIVSTEKLAQTDKIVSTENEKLTLVDQLALVKIKLKNLEDDSTISMKLFECLDLKRTDWNKIRTELIKDNLVYVVGTKTKLSGEGKKSVSL